MASKPLPTVIFIHPSDEMYGSDRSLLNLVRVSSKVCHPVVILPSDIAYEGQLSNALRAIGVEVLLGPIPVLRRSYLRPAAIPRWLVRSALGLWWLLREARRLQARVLVSNTGAAPGGPLVAYLLRMPHVWYLREIVSSPRWFRKVLRALARLPAGVVVTNSHATSRWLGEIPGRESVVMHNAVDVTKDPARLPVKPVAVFIGRLTAGKGWDVFVQAATRVRARVPEASFILAGGQPPLSAAGEDDIRTLIALATKGADWMKWVGVVERPRDLLRQSWVAVVPSRTPEGLGNVVLEAMAEGRAAIGTRIGGIPEMIDDGITGLLVAPDDAPGLADAIERMLTDRELAERMGQAGREAVTVRFRSELLENGWLALLTWTLSSGRLSNRGRYPAR